MTFITGETTMQNPFQKAASNNVNDPLAFVKKLWGDMQLPGMVTPTLSVDELDKQIKDLKTVESWLAVNMNMLKGTIQALEVQRATIAALKTMGESFSQATQASHGANQANDANSEVTQAWPMHTSKSAPPSASPAVVPEPTVEENEECEEEDEVAAPVEVSPKNEKRAVSEDAVTEASRPDNAPFHNPAAWWTVLQDQFKQALSHAMKDEPDPVEPQQTQATSKPRAKTARSKSTSTKSSAVSTARKAAPRSVARNATTAKVKTAAKTGTKSTAKTPAKLASNRSTKTAGKTPVRK
jgi:hypothetical protein